MDVETRRRGNVDRAITAFLCLLLVASVLFLANLIGALHVFG